LFIGNVQAQSTVQFANNDSFVEFFGANQDFVWISSDTKATIRTDSDGSLEITADVGANSADASKIELRVDDLPVAQFKEGGDVALYNSAGDTQLLYWDADNLSLGVNTGSPQVDVALDVVGNTHTTDLNVAHQTTSGNVVVNDELRGNTTLFVTTNTEFTALADEVLIRNDLFVEGDAQVSSNLTVNTDSLFVGNVEAQSTIEFTKGNSSLKFAGANQDFIFDTANTNTLSTIRTNANGSLIVDADKEETGVGTSRIDFRVDNRLSTRIEDTEISFYNTAGTAKRLNWNADNLSLGVNTNSAESGLALDVVGNTQTTDIVVTTDATVGNDLFVQRDANVDANLTVGDSASIGDDLTVGNDGSIGNDLFVVRNASVDANLSVSEDAAVGNNLSVDNNTLIGNDLSVVSNTSTGNLEVTDFVFSNLVPDTDVTRDLGDDALRWNNIYVKDGDFSGNVSADSLTISGDTFLGENLSVDNFSVSGNGTVGNTLTVDKLIVTTDAALPATISFTGVTDFEDINVTGVASFANLQVSSLTTNTAGLIGTGFVLANSTPTKIDDFDKAVSRGFKYIIHGRNDDPSSAYAIEINCSHNDTTAFFTRFGEVSNNFDCSLTPVVNGPDIELIAECPSAGSGNVHSFSIVRIETR
jgi:cytoskeletal protein CcmA (bactofilin family)